MRRALVQEHPDLDLWVNAVASGGHTTDNLLARIHADVLSITPTVVFIQIGVNDTAVGMTPKSSRVTSKP